MQYLLLSSLALAAFYLLYKWLLSRDTFHRFNRIVILVLMIATTLFPFVAPFLPLHLGKAASEVSIQLRELVVSPERVAVLDAEIPQASLLEAATPLTAMQASTLLLISLAVTAIFLFLLLHRLNGLRRRCHSHYETLSDGIRLVLHDDDYAPFSWMRYVVCSRKDYMAIGSTILAHERAHIRLHHSWDLLLAQVCCAVQWFNPAAWLMKRELQVVHEFEADEAMLHAGCNAHDYQKKLIETALGARFSSIANNFTHVSTKKRILMMIKKPTSPWARLKVLILIPVAAAAVFAASCTDNKPETDLLSDLIKDGDVVFVLNGEVVSRATYEALSIGSIDTMNALKDKESLRKFSAEGKDAVILITTKEASPHRPTPQTPSDSPLKGEGSLPIGRIGVGLSEGTIPSVDDDEVFQVVEEMPQYPGGVEALMDNLKKNLRYPKEAQDARKEGRVIAQFVVEKDGSITGVEVVRSVDPLLDAEAVRVIREMPKWTPGKQKGEPVRVKFTIPVSFKLQD
jgi:TonB family protein